MEDRDFFDHLYQVWSKTTGAQDRYWMPELHQGQSHAIWAVGQDDSRKRVATGMTSADADFITAIHGCFADLVRRLTEALDEADRLDAEKDDQEVRIAELVSELEMAQEREKEANSYADTMSILAAAAERELAQGESVKEWT